MLSQNVSYWKRHQNSEVESKLSQNVSYIEPQLLGYI